MSEAELLSYIQNKFATQTSCLTLETKETTDGLRRKRPQMAYEERDHRWLTKLQFDLQQSPILNASLHRNVGVIVCLYSSAFGPI